jgi:hypothetical protein
MRRVFRGYLVRFCIAGALLAMPGAAAATPDPALISKRVSVGSSGVTSATLRCPGRTLALSGYVTSVSGGAFARDSVPPPSIRSWTFRFTSSGGSGSARVGLRCMRVKLTRDLQRVRTKLLTAGTGPTVEGRSSRAARVSCGRGFVPTGYGLDRSLAGSAASRLLLASAVPASRSLAFRIENTDNRRHRAVVRVRCLGSRATGTRSGRSVSERFSIRRLGFSDNVGSGSVSHRCPSGRYGLTTGHQLPAGDDIFLTGSYPAGFRSGRWSFLNPSGGSEPVRTYLSCLSLRTRFR